MGKAKASQHLALPVVISIVSHGHSDPVARLLAQLCKLPAGTVDAVVLTLNAPELDERLLVDAALATTLRVRVIRNAKPQGFGANHNQAFKAASLYFGDGGAGVFCVVNPDIELLNELVDESLGIKLFAALANTLAPPGVGLAYPVQIDTEGRWLDFERALATPRAIFSRQVLRRLDSNAAIGWDRSSCKPSPHWVSGAFMAFKANVFDALGGFDERYFMYCEDVDICLRLQLAGYTLQRASGTVVHHTQRRTLSNLRHLAWHLRSLLRLWRSGAYHAYIEHLAAKKKQSA